MTARTPQNFSVPSPGPLNTPGKSGLGWAEPGALQGEVLVAESRPSVGWGCTNRPCPTVNPSSVMSPAGSSQAEEQQYLDKLKQLSKYIEPLRRMINKIDKNEGGQQAEGVGSGQGHGYPGPYLSSPFCPRQEKGSE